LEAPGVTRQATSADQSSQDLCAQPTGDPRLACVDRSHRSGEEAADRRLAQIPARALPHGFENRGLGGPTGGEEDDTRARTLAADRPERGQRVAPASAEVEEQYGGPEPRHEDEGVSKASRRTGDHDPCLAIEQGAHALVRFSGNHHGDVGHRLLPAPRGASP